MCWSYVKFESIFTPRFVTTDERGMVWPEKLMLVMVADWTWCGVPMIMASVFELFSCRKLSFIHAFISSRQVVSVDTDRAVEGVGFFLRYSVCHRRNSGSEGHDGGGSDRGGGCR